MSTLSPQKAVISKKKHLFWVIFHVFYAVAPFLTPFKVGLSQRRRFKNGNESGTYSNNFIFIFD